MRVLLVNPPIRTTSPPVDYPYGLASIASVLEKNKVEFDVLDINGNRFDQREVLRFLRENTYDIVGIGGLITVYSYIKWFISQVRHIHPETRVVVGGGVATWNPEFLLRHIKPDLVVSGEGEETFLDIVKNFNFRNMNDGKAFSGTAYLDENDRYIFSPRNLIADLDELPFPAWHKFPMENYISNCKYTRQSHFKLSRGISVFTGRGCPMECSFCYHIFGKGVRVRNLENVFEEIRTLRKHFNIDHINFLDESFTFKRKRILEFCEQYKNSGVNLPFRVYGRLDAITKEVVGALVDAGCIFYGVGVESGSPKILNGMMKRIPVEKMAQGIDILRTNGLFVSATFIHGMPGENETTVNESITFYKAMGFKNVRPFFIQPYPGTPMWTKDVEVKILKKYKTLEKYIETLGNALDFIINLSEVSDRKLLKLHRKITIETSGMSRYLFYLNILINKLKRVRENGFIWAINKLYVKLLRRIRKQL